ncbi:hypothetical protein M3Y97_00014400 [Aphelenchoides bicaudatus]|nr:hypothetical protein M3Y97_00014400 [Aphelenchoides bicaudatus]
MNRNFVLLIFVLSLPSSLALSRSEQIYLCNKNPASPQCSQLRENFTYNSIEPPNEEQDEELREHFTLVDLSQREMTKLENVPISTTLAPPPEKPLNNSCKYVDFMDLMIASREKQSFNLKIGLNYRLRFDEEIYENITDVKWQKGTKPIHPYDWSKSCVEQRISVDVDEKSLILLDVKTQYAQHHYTASFLENSSTSQVDVNFVIEKGPVASAYKNDIVLWACFAGVAVFVIILLIIAHLFHLRHMKRKLREWQQRHESDRPGTAAATQQLQSNSPSVHGFNRTNCTETTIILLAIKFSIILLCFI